MQGYLLNHRDDSQRALDNAPAFFESLLEAKTEKKNVEAAMKRSTHTSKVVSDKGDMTSDLPKGHSSSIKRHDDHPPVPALDSATPAIIDSSSLERNALTDSSAGTNGADYDSMDGNVSGSKDYAGVDHLKWDYG